MKMQKQPIGQLMTHKIQHKEGERLFLPRPEHDNAAIFDMKTKRGRISPVRVTKDGRPRYAVLLPDGWHWEDTHH